MCVHTYLLIIIRIYHLAQILPRIIRFAATEPATFIAACRDCGCPGRGVSDRDCRGHGDFANARDCPAPGLWSGTAARVGD